MKIEKSNNPVAVGALVLVLVLIVGRILWMVFGHGGPVAAASTISTGPTTPSAAPAPITKAIPAPAAVPASKAARASSIVLPATTRNPFSVALRPPRAVLHPDGLPRFDAMHRAALNDEIVPLTALPPFPVRISGLRAGAKQPWAPHGPSALLPHKAYGRGAGGGPAAAEAHGDRGGDGTSGGRANNQSGAGHSSRRRPVRRNARCCHSRAGGRFRTGERLLDASLTISGRQCRRGFDFRDYRAGGLSAGGLRGGAPGKN